MFEINTLENLNNCLYFPLITLYNDNRYFNVIFTFTNIADNTTHSTGKIDISTIGDIQLKNCTFEKLKKLLSVSDSTDITTCLETVYHDSELYINTILRLDVTLLSPTTDAKLTLSRHFLIPSIQSELDIISVPMLIEQHTLHCGYSVPILEKSNVITSTTFKVFVRTTWTDLPLYDMQFVKEKTIMQHINIAGFDMTRIFAVVTGKQMDNLPDKLLGYGFLDETMILIPHVDYERGRISSDDTTKTFDFKTTITSPVFDGLAYHDYGYLFFMRGFKFSISELEAAKLTLKNQ